MNDDNNIPNDLEPIEDNDQNQNSTSNAESEQEESKKSSPSNIEGARRSMTESSESSESGESGESGESSDSIFQNSCASRLCDNVRCNFVRLIIFLQTVPSIIICDINLLRLSRL